ncbi:MAG: carboxylate--amine ligase [Actinomycetaceae bacterium]|nr:carboxylate--amine ligase [Actinomycetaceae bacterium]
MGMRKDFLPVVLGSDINAYSVCRVIHQNYGIIPKVLCEEPFPQTSNSKILDRAVIEGFSTDDDVFLNTLIDFKAQHPDTPLILVICSDAYSELVSKHRQALAEHYLLNVNSLEMNARLGNKLEFYKLCEEYGIPYPQTTSCTSATDLDYSKLRYPIVAKAADSIRFYQLSFPGKRKAYVLGSEEELRAALTDIYDAGYDGTMIIQDYIPGDASKTMSLNAYGDQSGKIRMMALGQILLDEVLPLMIGNNNAIYTKGDPELMRTYEEFLNKLEYRGFSNIDLKFDERDGVYKAFEMNLRIPASGFFMQAGGLNYLDTYFRDVLGEPFEHEVHYYSKTEKLWLNVDPRVLKKYVNPSQLPLVKKLLKRGPQYSIWYSKDRSWARFKLYMRMRLGSFKHYAQHSNYN